MSSALRKLVECQWQMWEYRNQRFRGDGGTTESAEVAALDAQLEVEFQRGLADLPVDTVPNLRPDITLIELRALTHDEKLLFLEDVTNARKRFAAPHVAVGAYAPKRAFMIRWSLRAPRQPG